MRLRTYLLTFAVCASATIGITALYNGMSTRAKERATASITTSSTLPATSKNEPSRDPRRKWDVLDPQIDAEAVVVQSLNSQFSLFSLNTRTPWPMASISKLITAIVVAEDIGYTKRIPITASAIATEGTAGDLKKGDVYTAEDLAKIMLLTSSNDAATAFEDYLGGSPSFTELLRTKLSTIGMTETTMVDGHGISPENRSTAHDLIILLRYLTAHHPELLEWTRLQSYLVQPVNDTRSRTVYNIDALTSDTRFLGGKTGTSPEARENLLTMFSFGNERLGIVILGSRNRSADTETLLHWIPTAYFTN